VKSQLNNALLHLEWN